MPDADENPVKVSPVLNYAAGNFPPPRDRKPQRVPFVLFPLGTLVNYSIIAWAVHKCTSTLDGFVKAEGRVLWNVPKHNFYESQAIDGPMFIGVVWILSITSILAFLIARRRAHAAVTVIFVLINLFAIVVLVAQLDDAGMFHGLYP